MRKQLKIWKEIVDENPILVPVLINTAVVAGLTIWVARNDLNSRIALETSTTALRIALGE